jgi:tetratricopeptide (TPR) repeat protein
MENEKNINETATSNNKTMEYNNNVTKSIINQTITDIDNESSLEHEAYILAKKAEYKLRRRCCLYALCVSKNERYIDACDLYRKAGDKFKICNQWKKAGLCYENGALIKVKMKESPVNFYQQSYSCFAKIDIGDDSKRIFNELNKSLEKEGQYFQIAKNNENLAIQKENQKKLDEAINYYLQAIKYYEKDKKHEHLKIKIEIKLAELMMMHEHPDSPEKVPKMLENIGTHYLKKMITKYAAKDYFGKAILSSLYYSNNPSEGMKYINKIKKLDKSFAESSIYTLCNEIIKSMENNDINSMKKAIKKYKEFCENDEFLAYILAQLIEKMKINCKLKESSTFEENDNNEDNSIK